jgi:hypothetical protein
LSADERAGQGAGHEVHRLRNPEGLTEAGHTTTARDLSILATRLMQDFPEYVAYYAIKKYRYEGTPAANDSNRNLLLFRDPSVDGLKTGHTEAAGYCMIATARRDFPNLVRAPAGSAEALVAPPAVDRAGHGQRKCPRQRIAEAAELGLHRVRGGQAVRRQPAGGHAAVWKGTSARSSWAAAGHRGGRAGGQRGQDQDPGCAPRPAGGAVRQGPGGGHAQGAAQ